MLAWLCNSAVMHQVVLQSEAPKALGCLTGSTTITTKSRPRTATPYVACTTQRPIHRHRMVIQTEASLNASSYLSGAHTQIYIYIHIYI